MLINMKKSDALYLSAREASAELAISPATLYAYVSRGLIRSEPSPDSRSHRYRAEDIRGLKERRTPSLKPHAFKSFDPDLPVSEVATMEEVVAESIWQPRLYATLFGAFAGGALFFESPRAAKDTLSPLSADR